MYIDSWRLETNDNKIKLASIECKDVAQCRPATETLRSSCDTTSQLRVSGAIACSLLLPQGALSDSPRDRAAWRREMLAANTLAGVATMIYALVTSAGSVLPLLQEQDIQEQALVRQVRRYTVPTVMY